LSQTHAVSGSGSSRTGPPRVWLLTAHRAGDNTQVLALGEALDWPFEVKRFVYAPWETLVNWPFSSTLAGVDRARSSPLTPPWPDLVITAGRRNEPIARWIRRQADRPVRLVHVGRPWARPDRWDLIVTTPQYRLPAAPNILQNEAPLHRVTAERLAKEGAQWQPRFAHLPRPLIAVLTGGNSGPYPFDARSGERLGRAASALARELSGSLLVTTSARTRPEATAALFRAIDVPHFAFRWSSRDAENPYYGFLAQADRILVTGDSVSMMAEACATGRPVYLFDTGEGITSMRGDGPDRGEPLRWLTHRDHWNAFVYRTTMRFGPRRLTRDIRIVQQGLVASGRAAWLGEGEPAASPPPLRDLERAVARVRALFQAAH
jgi:mitochondrial fission protein ELM1